MKTICAWCKHVTADDGTPSELDSHGICRDCAASMGYDDERDLRAAARQADLDEETWARRALVDAPRCVIEDLAEGSLLSIAAKVAREMLQ